MNVRQTVGFSSRPARLAGAVLALAAVAATVTSSCNLVVDTDVAQCETSDDCFKKGPEFADSVCTKDKVCSAGGDCETNAECSARFGGAPSICRRPGKTCVQLTTPDCAEVFPADALTDDQTIVLGFIGPLSGADISSGVPAWKGVKLALNEFEQSAVGLPVKNSTERRRVAVIACDDANDQEAAASHLAKTVRAPIIFGPAFSSVTLDIATKVTIPAGSLLFSFSATSPAITDLNDKGLVWRTCPSDALQAIPMAALVTDLESEIRIEQSIPAGTPIRVAMTVLGDAYGTGLANAASALIKFNGKAANDNGDNFLRIDYKPDATDFSAELQAVTSMNPHIVLLVGTTETVTELFGVLKDDGNALKRYYAISDGGKIQQLLDSVSSNATLRQRVFGTAPGRTTAQYQAFKSRFKAFYANEDPLTYAEHAYDAAYLAAYALVATSDVPATGAAANLGLARTVGGVAIPAGPNQLNTAFSALLNQDGAIDYDGVSGPPDFDVNKGEAPADVDVWCINAANKFASSGQFYNSATNKVEGSRVNCN
ncbi:MAG: ABC transporter substrate-binding protein [Myxococcales bacterium]|nr:ABC transporter substrate-binding protein [Myxococcales bacterium]